MPIVLRTDIPGLQRVATGKVRDVYAVGGDQVLLVATDRVSAFDVVLNQGIPGKGAVLTQISAFWFERFAGLIPNHLLSADDSAIHAALQASGVSMTDELRQTLSERCLLCRRTKPLPIEAVVRGYLSGSAWIEYAQGDQGQRDVLSPLSLWGVSLPRGLRESDKLPQPIFTPSTKATAGHDEPMPQSEIANYIGEYAGPVRDAAIRVYEAAAEYARERGIIIADTKFEFGVDADGELLLIDEALTPDSSRFWPADTYEPGRGQSSFDKQFVRDFLLSVPGWDKQAPAPDLPDAIVSKTADKYQEAFRLLTGRDL
ncbi:MAG: phosphoribosylaminoimidazolesuccinocarboxamide synthase [Akkermansiaceae bacterium]|nr:phosphoribosylaminoimidazolesuccinocarboxamide synthase [Armatimonadota bacterium]